MINHCLKKKYHRLTPWLLFLVFFGPWLTAQVIYAKREQLSFKTLETGTLVSPPIQAQSLPFYDSAWLGKWQIVYMSDQNAHTKTDIEPMLKQLHKALGKEKHRVAYQIISVQNASLQHPSIKEVFDRVLLAPGEIALIDPRGWLMMHYPFDPDPIGMLKDIRRLLRYSHG
jgi:hypothetical protein